VDTSVDPVLIHQRGHEVAITDVASHESSSSIDGVCKPCGKIVEYNDIFACIDKGVHDYRADVSDASWSLDGGVGEPVAVAYRSIGGRQPTRLGSAAFRSLYMVVAGMRVAP
jgi:hypothetical protein